MINLGDAIAAGAGLVKEYIERARANPGKIKNATTSRAAHRSSPSRSMKRCWVSSHPRVLCRLRSDRHRPNGGEVDSATVAVPDTIEQHKAGS